MKGIIKEFKEFISRGNVIDLAVGVVVGGAFGKITTSLVNDIVMPFISLICGTRDMTALNWLVRKAEVDPATGEVVKEAIVIGFGSLVATVIDFLLIALVIFLMLKAINRAKKRMEKLKKQEEEAPAAPEPPKPTLDQELLTEIRDLLKEKNA